MTFFRKKRFYAPALIFILIIWFLNADFIGRWIYPIHYKDEILLSAQRYELDPFWITAIIRVESNYRPRTTSSEGAKGVMQLMPDTARWIAESSTDFSESSPDILYIPTINIRMGSWYIRYLHHYFGGYFEDHKINDDRDRLAVIAASYNAGQGVVQAWLTSGRWDGKLSTSRSIPYDETRHYVQRVDYYYKKYKNLYNELISPSQSTP